MTRRRSPTVCGMLHGDELRPFFTVPSAPWGSRESPPAGAHLQRPCTHVLPHRCGAALDVDCLELPETAGRAVELVDCPSAFSCPVVVARVRSLLVDGAYRKTHFRQWAGAQASRRRRTWWTVDERVSKARNDDAFGEFIDLQPAAPKRKRRLTQS